MHLRTRRLFPRSAMLLTLLGIASAAAAQSTQPSDTGATQDQASQAQTAPAGTPPGATPRGFAALDVDGNGKLDKDEAGADAALAAGFDKADADKDGSVSSTELDAFRQAPAVDGSDGQYGPLLRSQASTRPDHAPASHGLRPI